jgi:hypothetical protein
MQFWGQLQPDTFMQEQPLAFRSDKAERSNGSSTTDGTGSCAARSPLQALLSM